MPVCRRCKHRRLTSECVYDPAPTKKPGPSIAASPPSTVPRKTASMNLCLKLQSPEDYKIFAAGFPYVDKCPNGFLGPTAVLPRQIGLHLVYLHSLFLLERLSISRTHAGGQRLVDLAIQILDDVLTLWAKRDWLVDFQWRFSFVFTRYGVPSAGVFCVELLKAMKPSLDNTVVLPDPKSSRLAFHQLPRVGPPN